MKLRASTVVIILLIGLGASRPTMATELEFNAVEQNTLQVLLNYIRSGADLNAMHDGSSLLHCCAVKSRNRLARELVAGGIDVLLVDADGKRADQLTSGRGLTHNFLQDNLKSTLKTAVENNDKATIRRYLQTEHELNSPVDEDGNTLLHIASQYSRFAIANELVAGGIDVLLVDADGKRADQLTSGRGLTHNFLQDNLKSTLKTAVENNDKAIIRRYLQTEHELNSPVDEDGNTLLHIASQYSRFAITKELIAGGIDVLLVNVDGKRADQLTSRRGLTHNFSQDNLKTILKGAVENNQKSIIMQYLQTEHLLNAPVNDDGNTMLHIAAQHSRFAVAKALIKAGAAKNRLNNQGYKAYECTSGRGKTHQLLQPKLPLTFHGMNSNSERFSRVVDSIGLDYSAQNMTVIHLNAADYFDDGQWFSRSFALNIRSLLSGSVNHLEQLSQLRLNQTDIVELGRRLNLIKTEVEAMIERNGFDVNNVIFAGVSMGGMIASFLSQNMSKDPYALVCFNSFPLPQQMTGPLTQRAQQPSSSPKYSIFSSLKLDPTIPYRLAQETRRQYYHSNSFSKKIEFDVNIRQHNLSNPQKVFLNTILR